MIIYRDAIGAEKKGVLDHHLALQTPHRSHQLSGC